MKAQIRRWSNEEQKNYFVSVEVFKSHGTIGIRLDGITITDGWTTTQDALDAAEKIIRERKISNS